MAGLTSKRVTSVFPVAGETGVEYSRLTVSALASERIVTSTSMSSSLFIKSLFNRIIDSAEVF